jgi:hypothetical protein
VGTAFASAILPAHSMAGVRSSHAAVAVPHALGRRGRLVTDRISKRVGWGGRNS